MVAEPHVQQHVVLRRSRQRLVRYVLAVTIRLAAIPEVLDRREQQHPLKPALVSGLEDQLIGVEVDAARQQQAVVHSSHAEHGAREVRRQRSQRATENGALAVGVVVERAGVDRRLRRRAFEGLSGGEARRVDHQAAEDQLVEQALLQAVGHRAELRHVAKQRDRVWNVLVGHPDLRRGAEHHVVLAGHVVDVARIDLVGRAEQSVAVKRRASRSRHRCARNAADEECFHRSLLVRNRIELALLRFCVAHRSAGRAALREEAGHGYVAGDLARDPRALGSRVILDLVDLVCRGLSGNLAVGEVAVT